MLTTSSLTAPILILGGTSDARRLAQQLKMLYPHCQLIISLAGRTSQPHQQPVPIRVGGFGGMKGLYQWIISHQIKLVIIATHPFAAQMPINAVSAAAQAGIPVVRLLPPAWQPQQKDSWQSCHSLIEAAERLGNAPQRVFLPIGRQSVAAFAAAPHHCYVVRSIEPLDSALSLPHLYAIQERGPFSKAHEESLMAHWGITCMVCKNSGVDTMATKLHAAQALKIPIIMVERPKLPIKVATFEQVEPLINMIPALLD